MINFSDTKRKSVITPLILQAEIQSERLISYVRLYSAIVFCACVIFAFLIGTIELKVLLIQLTTAGIAIAYSSFYIVSHNDTIKYNFSYLLAALDITVFSIILWAFHKNGMNAEFITHAAFSAYLIVILFTAFHYKIALSILCGILSITAYILLSNTILIEHLVTINQYHDFMLRITLFIIASVLGAILSHNNSLTVKKIKSSENRYQNLVQRLPEMVFTLDSKGHFIWTNMASLSVVGIQSHNLIGKRIDSLLSNSESLKLNDNVKKGTFCITDKNGAEKYVDMVIQLVNSEEYDGAEIYSGIMTDVTDREKAIAQREEMVQRLYQYQKMESLGMLASGMAHDFNNILQTVNDLSSIIYKETNEEETKRRIELINETMADAKFLVSELFALGRKKPLDQRHVHINGLLEQIIPHLSKQIGPHYQLTLETPEQKLWVEGDPDHLKRIFQNLIGNSRDAMPEGGHITVTCKSIKRTDNEGVIQIRVSDTGTGIPPELTEKVFDPFFSTKKPGKGTGLGLALVRRILMLHSGSICIERTGYEGTIFLIELPMSSEAGLDSDTKAILLNRLSTTVLLLDDDKKIREVLRIFLKEFKYSVLEATDGNEAISLLKNNCDTCDVVIMDWKLGNENPKHVIKRLRHIKNDLIIIVVSGYPPDEKSVSSLHITRWFIKPYDRNLLDLEIQHVLHRNSVKRGEIKDFNQTSDNAIDSQ